MDHKHMNPHWNGSTVVLTESWPIVQSTSCFSVSFNVILTYLLVLYIPRVGRERAISKQPIGIGQDTCQSIAHDESIRFLCAQHKE